MQRMSRLTTETSLLNLFWHNGMTSLMEQEDFMIDGTALDCQCFYARYGSGALYEPTIFLNVLVEEVPAELALPLYRGGRVHLPLYWDAVAAWIWNK